MLQSDPYFYTEEERPKKRKHSTPDGPRYVVSMRSDIEDCRYKDFFETEKEKVIEAREKAEESVAKYGKGIIIYDRIESAIIHLFEPPMVAAVTTPETKHLRGKNVKGKNCK